MLGLLLAGAALGTLMNRQRLQVKERKRRAAQMQRLGPKRPIIRPHLTAPSIEDAKPDAYEPEF